MNPWLIFGWIAAACCSAVVIALTIYLVRAIVTTKPTKATSTDVIMRGK